MEETSNIEEKAEPEVEEQPEQKEEKSTPQGEKSEGNHAIVLILAIVLAAALLYFLLPALTPGTQGPSTLLK